MDIIKILLISLAIYVRVIVCNVILELVLNAKSDFICIKEFVHQIAQQTFILLIKLQSNANHVHRLAKPVMVNFQIIVYPASINIIFSKMNVFHSVL